MSMDLLISKIKAKNNPTVAGLDPVADYIPEYILEKHRKVFGHDIKAVIEATYEFNTGLIDALCDIVPAVKPQSAYYEMLGYQGAKLLARTIEYAKRKGLYVILDVKRNDIGSTAAAYAKGYFGNNGYGVESVTVNPYLGTDGIAPFQQYCDEAEKSIFVLVKTSNPSSGELQDLRLEEGLRVYEKMADMVAQWGSTSVGEFGYSNVGAVVGATYPAQLRALRERCPHTFFLVPGYGAQGAGAAEIAGAFDDNGLGAVINSSRGIMCAWKKEKCAPEDYAKAARREAIRMRDEILGVLNR